jgi:hypothetical protein
MLASFALPLQAGMSAEEMSVKLNELRWRCYSIQTEIRYCQRRREHLTKALEIMKSAKARGVWERLRKEELQVYKQQQEQERNEWLQLCQKLQ